MLITRYFLLMLSYHLVTFYKQRPVMFVKGLALFPYYFLNALIQPVDDHKDIISASFENIERYWKVKDAAMPPRFIHKRLEALRREVLR